MSDTEREEEKQRVLNEQFAKEREAIRYAERKTGQRKWRKGSNYTAPKKRRK
jgi:hypothetical protein